MQTQSAIGRPCWRCRADAAQVVCANCSAIQPIGPDTDSFALLELPRRLDVDAADLERRYHAASRATHPDRFQTASPEERELSLRASAAVNRAYRTLREPVARGRYWLELHGRRLGDRGPNVPAALAAEVFETQEKLEELRAAGTGPEGTRLRTEVRALHDVLAARLGELGRALEERYAAWGTDGASSLDELGRRLSEIAYLRTLLGDLEDAVLEEGRGTHHRH